MPTAACQVKGSQHKSEFVYCLSQVSMASQVSVASQASVVKLHSLISFVEVMDVFPFCFQAHLLTHAELRPYVCQYCDAGFTNAQSLRTHLHTHRQVRDLDLTYAHAVNGTSLFLFFFVVVFFFFGGGGHF